MDIYILAEFPFYTQYFIDRILLQISNMNNLMQLIAVLPPGLEKVGAKELVELGAIHVNPLKRSVGFEAEWPAFFKIHLFARLPFRFLRQIAIFTCNGPQSLYREVQHALDWTHWLSPSHTFRVDVTGQSHSPGLNHSHFSALQVKNAIVDLQRQEFGQRSSINIENPDFCIHLHLRFGEAVLSLATSSQSLHRRGYRPAVGLAPLKENLAAGLILSTGWDGTIPLIDPLCGSGTFLIEAASFALGLAPGLNRNYLFEKWRDFDKFLWKKEIEIARKLENKNKKLPLIIGCEKDTLIANQARENISLAGLSSYVQIKNIDFCDLQLPKENGMIICNPPYGKRLGEENELITLYRQLGVFCKQNASGWQFWILNGNRKLSTLLKMKASKRMPISNGGIDCRWLNYQIN